MYKLYTDKSEIFECKINLQGASIKNAIARLVLESEDWNLVFQGTIDSNGKCKIPIKRLNILNENASGTLKLEVISEDIYFQPWKSDFKVEQNKKAIVEVISQKTNKSKPSIEISDVVHDDDKKLNENIKLAFIKELDTHNITLNTLVNYKPNKRKIDITIARFINKHKLSASAKPILINEIINHFFNTNT